MFVLSCVVAFGCLFFLCGGVGSGGGGVYEDSLTEKEKPYNFYWGAGFRVSGAWAKNLKPKPLNPKLAKILKPETLKSHQNIYKTSPRTLNPKL